MSIDKLPSRRIGGAVVETTAQVEALSYLEPTLGVAHQHGLRIDGLIAELVCEVRAASAALEVHREDADLQRMKATIIHIRGPIKHPADFKFVVLARLARLLDAPPGAITSGVADCAKDSIARNVDLVRGDVMQLLAMLAVTNGWTPPEPDLPRAA